MRVFCSLCLVVFLGGCASYTTPGAGVNVGNLEAADEEIGELLTNARVTSTASAALYDVRTGFLYGVAESTAREEQRATFWSSDDAVDNARLKTEAEAFQSLLGEVEKLWNNVLAQRPTTA